MISSELKNILLQEHLDSKNYSKVDSEILSSFKQAFDFCYQRQDIKHRVQSLYIMADILRTYSLSKKVDLELKQNSFWHSFMYLCWPYEYGIPMEMWSNEALQMIDFFKEYLENKSDQSDLTKIDQTDQLPKFKAIIDLIFVLKDKFRKDPKTAKLIEAHDW